MFLTHKHWISPFRYKEQLDQLYQKPVTQGKLLFYGSSTFVGWKNLRTDIPYELENHSFGGSVTDEALFHYQKLVVDYNPSAMVWYFGDNDFVCHYTVDEVEYLTHKTWGYIRAQLPNLPIIILATKVCPDRHQNADKVVELNARLKAYAQSAENVYYVETYDICKPDGNYDLSMYLADQLHFSKLAYDKIAQRLNPLLKEILK